MHELLPTPRERRLGVMAGVSFVCGYLTLYPLLWLLFGHADGFVEMVTRVAGFLTPGILLILAATPAYAGHYISRTLKEKRNESRSARLRLAASRDTRAPFVFLRPFAAGPLTSEPARHYGPKGQWSYGRSYGHAIADALRNHGRMVAIGAAQDVTNYYENTDVMFIQSAEKTWIDMFSDALAAARAIIVIPGVSEGLLREVHLIRNRNVWDKVLVFMAPLPDPNRQYKFTDRFVDERAPAKEWDKVRALWMDLGFELPPYDPRGLLYASGTDFRLERAESLNYDMSSFPAALELLLSSVSGAAMPLSDVLPKLLEREAPKRRPDLFSRIYLPG